MSSSKHSKFVFQILSAIFIASLIMCNLIFQKFFEIDIWLPFIGAYTFKQSVGLLAYPVTFLVTDIISEIYGQKKANQVITTGLIASLFMVLMVSLANFMPSAEWGTGNIFANNPANDGKYEDIFSIVFGLSGAAVFASMMAYLIAQYVDVRVFHFWKRLTNGKHLWLRNNASTMFSQLIDTITVILLLCSFNVIPWADFWTMVRDGFLFKIFFAAFDTPIIYMCCSYLRTKYGLGFGQTLYDKSQS